MTNWQTNTAENTPTPNSTHQFLEKIAHLYTQIHLRHKLKLAQTLLQNYAEQPIMVFCSRKRDKFLLFKYLQKAGITSDIIPDQITMPTIQPTGQITISSDTCPFNSYKSKIKRIVHFDIPPQFNSYITRLMLMEPSNNPQELMSHAIVTQREVPMLQSFHTHMKIATQPQLIDGFEDEPYRPYDEFEG